MPLPPKPGKKEFEVVFRGDGMHLGIYRCAHTNVGRGPEQMGIAHTINVPTRGVYVKNGPRGETFVDPRNAVFFNARECFQTRHPWGFGDEGYYLALAPAHLSGLLADLDPAAAERRESMFAPADGPLPASALLASHRLFRAAEQVAASPGTRDTSTLAIEEATLDVVRSILRPAFTGRRIVVAAPSPASRRDLARDAAGIVVRRCTEPLSLAGLARELGVSPFHLSRTFRTEHGRTLRDFHDEARLRLGLSRLRDGECDLTRLALELGFASHSHFSLRFRRRFGMSPSRARTDLDLDGHVRART